MIRAGELYGVTKWMGICGISEVAGMRKRWGDRVGFSVWTEHHKIGDGQEFTKTNVRIVKAAARAGCHCIKFWYKPEFNERAGVYFNDPRLDAVFEAMVDLGLPALVHIADPDIWWQHHYHDTSRFEPKWSTYRQLTQTLARFPSLRVMAAHMGGWPENLPRLDEMLDQYRNLYLDTSGTKWIARELSHQAESARSFVIRRADRLLFGSDLVAFDNADFEHHCSRYWVHRHLYEKAEPIRSPIADPDANGPVFVAGLNLPDAVLSRLYRQNAELFFGLR